MKKGQKERKEGGRGKRGANRKIKVNGWKRENQLYFLLCLSSLVLVVQLPKAHRPASGDVIIPYMDSAGLCLPADSLPGGFCSALSIPPNPCHQPFFFNPLWSADLHPNKWSFINSGEIYPFDILQCPFNDGNKRTACDKSWRGKFVLS